jgi:hypothetical protein
VKNLLTPLAVVALAGAASAQTTYLSEDFNAGVVPPAGWTHVNNNANPAVVGWISDGARAWCEDEAGVGQADVTLVSPVMDLTAAGAVWLHFDGETNWANYLANHPSSLGNGISNMEISTDGGLTWTVVWTDTSLNSGDTYSPSLDISSYAGNASVQVGVHFSGDWAQEWWVDNVVVDDQAPSGGPSMTVSGTCPGTMTLSGSGMTASGAVAIVYGPAGSFTVPGGSCAGLVLDIAAPTLGAVVTADAAGDVSISPSIPGAACGSTVQMIDLTACAATNSEIL